MSASYEVVLLHDGLVEFAREVQGAARDATREVLSQPNLLGFGSDISTVSPDSHVVIVYLGSREGSVDSVVREALQEAVDNQFPILPIVRHCEPGTIREKLPSVIENINAADWDSRRREAIVTLLGMLGLVEQERKLFLSYRRRESSQVALQLHTELVRRRFDVFLDRFALPPGADFQTRLDEDLGDKAFVVLLESSDLRNSRWVQHEIAYAHSHRINVLAITLPGVSDSQLVSAVDDAFRIRLVHGDVEEDGRLAPTKLRAILEEIEYKHAQALRRRREQMLGSLWDQLRMDGCSGVPLKDWAVLATGTGKRSAVWLVTPRRPVPEDLYALDVLRGDAAMVVGDARLAGALVHDVEHLPEEEQRVLAWIGKLGYLEVNRLMECVLEEEATA
ncbi:MAG: toll/interleukin-1 receptor domain-containing protein [Gammaproteobacteria bacterium]|nr:toll/interleukin-1 receptor domain-containing protein [Gammaproteobacteria bacterium]